MEAIERALDELRGELPGGVREDHELEVEKALEGHGRVNAARLARLGLEQAAERWAVTHLREHTGRRLELGLDLARAVAEYCAFCVDEEIDQEERL
jgi:hypothetical protein